MSKRKVIRKSLYIAVLLMAGSILLGGCGEKEEGQAETEVVEESEEGGEAVKAPPTTEPTPKTTPIPETIGEKEPIKATSEPIEKEVPVSITSETIIYEYNEDNILNLKAIYVNGNTVTYRFGRELFRLTNGDKIVGRDVNGIEIAIKNYEVRYEFPEQYLLIEYEAINDAKGFICHGYDSASIFLYDFSSPQLSVISYEDNGKWVKDYHQEYDAINACWGEVMDYSGEREQYGVVFD